jgi:hypothetical protein
VNITNIPAPRVPFIDERTGLMAREWYRFFLNLFVLTGSGNNPITLEELQLGPPNQPDLAELLIQINQNIAPQYEDQSGDFLKTLDTAQLMSMMSQFANAEAAIQGAYLQPVVQTGTIASYNLDSSPTAGGVAYGTGPALAVSAAGTVGQVLTSGGAGAPTWATDGGGTVTSVSVVSANGLAGTVATATTTPAITLSTTITGLLKGNGTAISAAISGTDYAPATSGTSILYGNGAGGFSNVTIGTGVAFAGGTLSATGSGGTVTSVTGTAPVVSSGGATPAISMAAATTSVNGYLTSTDWTTFNNKGSGTVTSVAASVPAFLSISGSPITTSGTLAIALSGTALPVLNGGTGVTTSTGTGNTVLSAAPTLSGNVTLSTGNLVIGTSGQGIDFSATASGSGTMTSELLADYEEGTFSPRFAGSTTAGTWAGYGFGTYRKVGKLVAIWWEISQDATHALTGAAGDLIITNLPFSQSGERGGISYSVFVGLNLSALANALYGYVTGSNIVLSIGNGGNTFTTLTITTNYTTSSLIYGSAVYATAA